MGLAETPLRTPHNNPDNKMLIRYFFGLLFLLTGTALAQTTYHVDTAATPQGTTDGLSWPLAFNHLQDALAVASPGDTILVAEGTYYPDEGASQTDDDCFSTFALIAGLTLQGGFPTGGGQRDIATHLTILSGDLDQNDDSGDISNNAFHVLKALFLPSEPELDGFIIRGGNANESVFPDDAGGGIFCENTSLRLVDCVFDHNNAAGEGGGAVYGGNSTNLTVIACSFQGNDSRNGGAARHDGQASYERCAFQGNTALFGAAIFTIGSGSDVTCTNCLFAGNSASSDGGAIASQEGPQTSFINCSFQGNATAFNGGALNLVNATTNLTNCLIWDNVAAGTVTDPSSSFFEFGSEAVTTFTHCLVDNVDLTTVGTGNLDGSDFGNDPLFVFAPSPFNAPSTGADLRLEESSPAHDVGLNSANSFPVDLAGNTRILDGIIDLGCFETASASETEPVDSDNDGLPDLLETILGTDPNVPDSDSLKRPRVLTDAVGYTFGIDPAPSDFRINVYRTTDLVTVTQIFSYRTSDHTQISADDSLMPTLESDRITLLDSATDPTLLLLSRGRGRVNLALRFSATQRDQSGA